MTMQSGPTYEFDSTQNAVFAKLGSAMTFVAVSMLVVSAMIALAVLVLARSTLTGSVIVAPLGLAVAVIGAQLFRAGRRFHRIVATRGNDISNLMFALEEIATAYRVQRWLWLTVSLVIVVALIATTAAA